MTKNKSDRWRINFFYSYKLIIFFCGVLLISWTLYNKCQTSSYSFFIEFNNANGIKKGTPIRMRGVYIGSVEGIKLKINCVISLVKIYSGNIIIPRNSVIETNQTGLLNETVIDIMPFKFLRMQDNLDHSPISKYCDCTTIICKDMYLVGDRGLNYDDLVRSTTRISQRFDDPRFFNLFYVFLQNSIELTDNALEFIATLLDILSISNISFGKLLSDDRF